jgi:uncharacterized protein YkwD
MRLVIALLVTLVLGGAVLPAPAGAAGVPGRRVLRLLNHVRASHGLPALNTDRRLALAARGHSADMVSRRYFAHASPEGEQAVGRVRRTGWLEGRARWRIGEDLAWGIGGPGTPAGVVRAWMHSPPHRRIILTRVYRVVGIGVATGTPVDPGQGATYTADFGG